MEFSMSGDMIKEILGDKGDCCFVCGETTELTTCKACKLTMCKDCMSNEDLCHDCMYQLETTGGFDTYTGHDFEEKMYNKYIKGINSEKDISDKNKDTWTVELTETDNEIWHSDIECESKEQAIEFGMKHAKEQGLKSFRIGKTLSCEIPTIDVDDMLERVSEDMYDKFGEVSESYLDNVSKEQLDELKTQINKVFYDWNIKHKLEPHFYQVIDTEVIKVI